MHHSLSDTSLRSKSGCCKGEVDHLNSSEGQSRWSTAKTMALRYFALETFLIANTLFIYSTVVYY